MIQFQCPTDRDGSRPRPGQRPTSPGEVRYRTVVRTPQRATNQVKVRNVDRLPSTQGERPTSPNKQRSSETVRAVKVQIALYHQGSCPAQACGGLQRVGGIPEFEFCPRCDRNAAAARSSILDAQCPGLDIHRPAIGEGQADPRVPRPARLGECPRVAELSRSLIARVDVGIIHYRECRPKLVLEHSPSIDSQLAQPGGNRSRPLVDQPLIVHRQSARICMYRHRPGHRHGCRPRARQRPAAPGEVRYRQRASDRQGACLKR